jgi:hypothetical protein
MAASVHESSLILFSYAVLTCSLEPVNTVKVVEGKARAETCRFKTKRPPQG